MRSAAGPGRRRCGQRRDRCARPRQARPPPTSGGRGARPARAPCARRSVRPLPHHCHRPVRARAPRECVRTSRPLRPRRRCSTTSGSVRRPSTTTSSSRSAPTTGEVAGSKASETSVICVSSASMGWSHDNRHRHGARDPAPSREKWKRGTIVAELGVHSDVVARVLDRGAGRALLVAPMSCLVDPFEAYIDETIRAHPRLRATRLFAHDQDTWL